MTATEPGLVAGRPGVRCSLASAALDEPLGATAPVARVWVALEQSGPYGRKALTDSHLDPATGAALTAATEGLPVTVVLVRRPGPHADLPSGHAPRRFWVADTMPGTTRLVSGTVADPAELLDWDWPALAGGVLPGAAAAAAPGPLLLVCTNGRRDLCCALAGRDLVRDLVPDLGPDREHVVWEASHLGGHRFAPTVLLLPWGTVHGRLDVEDTLAVLDAATGGELDPRGYRGRSTWSRAAQAAEAAVREHAGVRGLDDLVVEGSGPELLVRHADGRTWRVAVDATALEPRRPESCGKASVVLESWRAVAVTAQD